MKHKFTEILIEIAIIVFAISLSLFLERWRERVADHHLEKEFYKGLKVDLDRDRQEMEALSGRCTSMKQAAVYFQQPGTFVSWQLDSVNLYGSKLFHNLYFFLNSNRYESLKSTGKLGVIEEDSLRNQIIDLYQTKIPDLQQQVYLSNEYINHDVKAYVIDNLQRDGQNKVVFTRPFFTSMKMQNLLMLYGDLDDVLRRVELVQRAEEKILAAIDR